MLEPREADIYALFLFFVVLPLVAYFLLGKWSEAAKKRERISLLAQLASEEALRAEGMAAASVIPVVPSSKNGLQVCARCFATATTRCSRCKAVRYCSGRCQILHWRQSHKQECEKLETINWSSFPNFNSLEDSVLHTGSMSPQFLGYNNKQAGVDKASLDSINYNPISIGTLAEDSSLADNSQVSMLGRSSGKKLSQKPNRKMLRTEDTPFLNYSGEASRGRGGFVPSNNISSKDAFVRHKLESRTKDSVVAEEALKQCNAGSTNVSVYGQSAKSGMHDSHKHESQRVGMFEPRSNYEFSKSLFMAKDGAMPHQTETNFDPNRGNLVKQNNFFGDETEELDSSGIATSSLHLAGPKITKPPKSSRNMSREQLCSEIECKEMVASELKASKMQHSISAQGTNVVPMTGIKKMIGLGKSTKLARQDAPELCGNKHKKIKMLFPYEEFVKFFHSGVFGLSPRGLLNCGNSCYANAVLQCLTCTRPLIIYLLHRSHSRACYGKDWCLMCELEQHVFMLRESGGALSLSRILSHMRTINCQIGDGSQEDAHEFLRLLIASMQSICLEGLGGEHQVDPRLQETTFIQHTFGGRLKSKVKCLRCYHESERYENIMDLTLEIYGWVESLQDALTQFTTPEDLDGENMYRCGRCAAYVQARKQLSIHEAPNILTIVLKRFQEGRYGKINKCITFPEMLDMVPFMTEMGDIPPLYILYAVVVHLDTLNASFSGHYVSYVKDLQGNWFRIDDTEVHPVSISQVMSEGAYILFYMRSSPRPQRVFNEKAMRKEAQVPPRHSTLKTEKPSRSVQSKPDRHFVGLEPFSELRLENASGVANKSSNSILRHRANNNILPMMDTYTEGTGVEFSDATSSDWSLFISSDEASFTTESTRDSFSTVDYADMGNADPFSIFNNIYPPESSYNTVSCRMFSNSSAQTRYVLEEKGYVVESYLTARPVDGVEKGKNMKEVCDSSTQFVRYGSNPKYSFHQTSVHCKP